MKKTLFRVLALIAFISLISCTGNDDTLNKNKQNIINNDKFLISLGDSSSFNLSEHTVLPVGVTAPLEIKKIGDNHLVYNETESIKIVSSNPQVIEVSEDKTKIITKSIGSATLNIYFPTGEILKKVITTERITMTALELKDVPSSMNIGLPVNIHLYAKYSNGKIGEIDPKVNNIKWTVTPIDSLLVNQGTVIAKNIGVATIKAEFGGLSTSNSTNIQATPLTSIFTVNPQKVNLLGLVGNSQQITARLISSDGSITTIDKNNLTCKLITNNNVIILNNGCELVAKRGNYTDSGVLEVSYKSYKKKINVEQSADNLSNLSLNISSDSLGVGQDRLYSIYATTNDNKVYDVTNDIALQIEGDSIKDDYLNHKLIGDHSGVSTIKLIYNNKVFVTKTISVNESIKSISLMLKDENKDIQPTELLIPHKTYTITINCKNNVGNVLSRDECGIKEIKFNGQKGSYHIDDDSTKLTALLAGDIDITVQTKTLTTSVKYSVGQIRNPVYEHSGPFYSAPYREVSISDELAGVGYNLLTSGGNNEYIQDMIKSDLAKQGRYNVFKGAAYDEKDAWNPFVLTKHRVTYGFEETNLPVPVYYKVSNDNALYRNIVTCKTNNNVWKEDSQIKAVKFEKGANDSEGSNCDGEKHNNAGHSEFSDIRVFQ